MQAHCIAHTDAVSAGVSAVSMAQAGSPEAPLTDFVERLFDTAGFPPRWQCGDWDAVLGWLHILSDIGIFVAYAAIPVMLLFFVLRRRDVPLRLVFWLFAAFILSCGLTHAMDAVMFYHPMYRVLGLMKLVTAIVSLTTVAALARLVPVALQLPTTLRLTAAELERCRDLETQIRDLNDRLQDRNSALTVRQRRIETAMTTARSAAVRWDLSTGAIDWETGIVGILGLGGSAQALTHWSQVLDAETLERLIAIARARAEQGLPISDEVPVAGVPGVRAIRISAAVEPGTQERPMVVGMVRALA